MNPIPEDSEVFGQTIDVDRGRVLVGAPQARAGAPGAGATYLFDGAHRRAPSDVSQPHASAERIVRVVRGAAQGDTVLVGAPYADDALDDSGAAYLFDATTGALLQTFLNPTPEDGEEFGLSVAFVAGNGAVGAPYDNDAGALDAGAAYRQAVADPTNNYRCYTAATVPGTPRFAKRDVTLDDAIEGKATTVLRPVRFCTPTSLGTTAIVGDMARLTCYRIRDVKGQPKLDRQDVLMLNEFGTQHVTIKKRSTFASPSLREARRLRQASTTTSATGWPRRRGHHDSTHGRPRSTPSSARRKHG